MKCRNCGDEVDPRRVEAGYDYCLKDECQERCVKRVTLASIGVNKAADYYTTADELLPPPAPVPKAAEPDDETDGPDGPDGPDGRARHPSSTPRPRSQPMPTTMERLRAQEAALDEALKRNYERFRRGEITAREMDRQGDDLVEAFNQQVRRENIRYRSLLRPRRRKGR